MNLSCFGVGNRISALAKKREASLVENQESGRARSTAQAVQLVRTTKTKNMKRYLALLQFTDKGAQKLEDSPKRAATFRKAAEKEGVQIEAQYWALGKYDGIVILSAVDETAVLRQ